MINKSEHQCEHWPNIMSTKGKQLLQYLRSSCTGPNLSCSARLQVGSHGMKGAFIVTLSIKSAVNNSNPWSATIFILRFHELYDVGLGCFAVMFIASWMRTATHLPPHLSRTPKESPPTRPPTPTPAPPTSTAIPPTPKVGVLVDGVDIWWLMGLTYAECHAALNREICFAW